jgi:hypothetical protein
MGGLEAMTTTELLAVLRAQAHVRLVDGQLEIAARRRALTPELRTEIAWQKHELVAALEAEAAGEAARGHEITTALAVVRPPVSGCQHPHVVISNGVLECQRCDMRRQVHPADEADAPPSEGEVVAALDAEAAAALLVADGRDIVAALAARGITVRLAEDGRPWAGPTELLDEADMALLAAHRDAVLAALRDAVLAALRAEAPPLAMEHAEISGEQMAPNRENVVMLHIDLPGDDPLDVDQIADVLARHPGPDEVLLHIVSGDRLVTMQVGDRFRVVASPAVKAELDACFGREVARLEGVQRVAVEEAMAATMPAAQADAPPAAAGIEPATAPATVLMPQVVVPAAYDQPRVTAGDQALAVERTMVASAADWEGVKADIVAEPVLGIDTEATGLGPFTSRLRLVQLAVRDRVYLVDVFQLDPRALQPILDHAQRLIGQNLKFDLRSLMAAGLRLPPDIGRRLSDTMLAGQLLGAGLDGLRHRLADLTQRYLGLELDKTEQVSDWSGDLTEDQLAYAARDAAVLLPLRDRLRDELERADLGRVAGIESRALPAMAWLEQSGAPFDQAAWLRLADIAEERRRLIERELDAMAPSDSPLLPLAGLEDVRDRTTEAHSYVFLLYLDNFCRWMPDSGRFRAVGRPGSGWVSGRVALRVGGTHAFVGEGAQTGEVAVLFGWIVLARGGLLPEAAGCEEPAGAVAAEALIEVQQRADGPVLVVVAVELRQVPVQVGAQDVGVGARLESGERKAVALPGVDEFAVEQHLGEAVAKVCSAVEADQPCSSEPRTPFAVEQRAEFAVGDLPGVAAHRGLELGSFRATHVQRVAVEKLQVPSGPGGGPWIHVTPEGGPQLRIVGSRVTHCLIVARPVPRSPGLPVSLIMPCRDVGRFAEFGEQAADAVCGALVALDLALPAAFSGIVGQLPLQAKAFAKTRCVLRGGDELRAGQVDIALTRPFLGQTQAVAELQLGLVELRLEPVQSALVELTPTQGLCQGTGDDSAGLQDRLVVGGEHDGIGDVGIGHRHPGAEVPEDLHDRLGASAILGELRAQGMAEAVGMEGRLAFRRQDPELLADTTERGREQVVDVGELAVGEEQVSHRLAGVRVDDPPVLVVLPQRLEVPDGFGRLGMHGDGPLLERLAGRESQAWRPVGVGVEAVQVQSTDLAAARSAPAGDQQGAPLLRTLQGPYRCHDRLQLMLGDVPGHPLDRSRYARPGQHWSGGHVRPLGMGTVAEEHRHRGDDPAPGGFVQRFVGVLDLRLLVEPGQEVKRIGPCQLGQALDRRATLNEPVGEPSHRLSGGRHGRRPHHESAFDEVSVHDGCDTGLGAERRSWPGSHAHRQAIAEACVEQRESDSVDARRPRQLDTGQLFGWVHFVHARNLVGGPNPFPHLFDVAGSDRSEVGISTMQHQPARCPQRPEPFGIPDIVPKGSELLAKLLHLGRQRQAELIRDLLPLDYSDSQQPAPVQAHPPGQGQVDEVRARVVVDPARCDVEAIAGAAASDADCPVSPAQSSPQWLVEPVGQVRKGAEKASVLSTLQRLGALTLRTLEDERLVFVRRAVSRSLVSLGGGR